MASSSREGNKHPPWHGPHGSSDLKVHNSLTSSPTPFVPINSREVKWYICGPTVYDSAHLGHARAYVTFDIMRRILSDYFNYNVFVVMNITDIDDKIILRARRNHLIKQFAEEQLNRDVKQARHTVVELALRGFAAMTAVQEARVTKMKDAIKAETRAKIVSDLEKTLEEEKMKLNTIIKDKTQFDTLLVGNQASIQDTIEAARSQIAAELDKQRGASIDDQKVFNAHTRRYETEFLEDMRELGVRDVDALTRVTEYVPKIISFVQKIIEKGFAYEVKGSGVYLDTVAYSKKHTYGKLCPSNVGNVHATQDAEGSLSAANASEKRAETDFALWKVSKPGEPKWDSPWGWGRPGWHIECSAMATDLLGDNFDVHSGGEDLKFPHHDNEICQSEAYSGKNQWANHWWHAGHLNIDGYKMSKSLKNFITIRDVLKRHSGRQIRLLFLLQSWDGKMSYSEGQLKNAATKEKTFKEFFLTVNAALRDTKSSVSDEKQSWDGPERALHALYMNIQQQAHDALCDNFNYPTAVNALVALVNEVNKYMIGLQQAGAKPKVLLLRVIAAYVDKMLRMFGVMGDGQFGFVGGDGASASTTSGGTKYMDAFANFRARIRALAQSGAPAGDILKLCDDVRDKELPKIGVRLEDVGDGETRWKEDNPDEMKREADAKMRDSEAKAVKKLVNKIKRLEKELVSLEKGALSGRELLASKTSEFSAFAADTGLPTLDAKGEPLSKSVIKKMKKLLDKQDKYHAEYTAELAKDPQRLEKLRADIEALKST